MEGGGGCSSGEPIPPWELAGRIIGAVALLLLAALFSGLTLGVLGLDLNDLEITKASGTPTEKKNAEAIIPIRAQGNLLLCTLVLGNVAVTSLESILMADLTSGLVGFVLTTVLVVIFGEIVPQAFCARYGLAVGAKSVPVVKAIIFLFYPFTKPLALCLDWALGEEKGNSYTRAGIKHLITMHMEQNAVSDKEGHIIHGALAYRTKEAQSVMTPRDRIFALKQHDRLDSVTMELVFRKGYSRVPVWNDDETNVVGLLCACAPQSPPPSPLSQTQRTSS